MTSTRSASPSSGSDKAAAAHTRPPRALDGPRDGARARRALLPLALAGALVAGPSCDRRPILVRLTPEGPTALCQAPSDGHVYMCVCEPKLVRLY